MTKLNVRAIRNVIWIFFLASFIYSLASETSNLSQNVKNYVYNLTTSNFNNSVLEDESTVWVVCFCTNWCNHCTTFKPEYRKSAMVMRSVAKFGAVDCDAENSLGEMYKITQVPTIKIFVDEKGHPREFSGCKKSSALVEAVLWDLRCMVHQRLLSAGSITPMIPNDNIVNDIVNGTCLFSERQEAAAGDFDRSQIIEHRSTWLNSLNIFRNSNSRNVLVSNKLNSSLIVQLNSTSFRKKVLETRGCWVIVFYAPWCCHSKCLAPHLLDAAERLKGKMTFGAVDCTANRYLACKYNITYYPTILLFPDGSKHVHPEIYNGSRNTLDLINWCLSKWEEEIPDNEVLQLCHLQ
ncbi:PDIA6 [Cordylochernes scorpioides]|uniref:PDIA6 n=1 Tax=Cordylochernes scorpioides TaxID=51811 RepID=A0ABY6KQI0_9ARAC|nr:PDIA6 [Cordylochernes scorpioides]